MVNEDEYSDIVRQRQEEDFVIDDGMKRNCKFFPYMGYSIPDTKRRK